MNSFITGYTKIFGVIGHNIDYTKSPLIHNYWYRYHNMDSIYVKFEAHKNNFQETVKGLFNAGIIGLNVTVPFKEDALMLCDDLTEDAERAKAVNCLMLKNNKILGHNTDGLGFYNSLCQLDNSINLHKKSILIIGAGGAASSIISYLSQFELTIYILNRTYEKAKNLEQNFINQKFNIQIVDKPCYADIIIQTTNLKKIEADNIINIPDNIIMHASYIIDINYGDNAGDFLLKPELMNIKHCDGSEMLLQQAALAFKFFNDKGVYISNELRKIIK